MDQAQFHALVQSEVKKTITGATPVPGSTDTRACFNCKEVGHKKSDCPKPPSGEPFVSWRAVGPKPGEPTTIIKSGRTFNFCTKCKGGKGFWTATHATEGHGKPPTPVAPAPSPVQANMASTDNGLGIYQF